MTGSRPLLLAAALALAVGLLFRFELYPVAPGMDAPYYHAFNWAAERHLRFGDDFLSTYGPFGHLIITASLGGLEGAALPPRGRHRFAPDHAASGRAESAVPPCQSVPLGWVRDEAAAPGDLDLWLTDGEGRALATDTSAVPRPGATGWWAIARAEPIPEEIGFVLRDRDGGWAASCNRIRGPR